MVRFNSSRTKINKKMITIFSLVSLICLALVTGIYANCVGNRQIIPDTQNVADNNNNMQTSKGSKSSYVVMEGSRNLVLDRENENVQLPMASTTKVMTAYIACISGKLNEVVTIPKCVVGIEGSSVYLKEGEKYKLIDLVYGLMLQSGNDAAEAIARFLGKDIKGFADIMNSTARKMGLKNTNFVNPHGLHDDNHYTSAYDLAYITCEVLKNEDFATICSTKAHKFQTISGENKCYINKNKLLNLYDGCIGVKTGFTKKAGRCLVSASKRNGVTIVSVVLNKYDMWRMSMANLDRGFSLTKGVNLAKANETFAKVESPSGQILNLGFLRDINYALLKDETLNLTYDITLDKNLPNNICKGKAVGKIEFFNDNKLILQEKIYNI